MTAFRYSGIPEAIAAEARHTMRSPQYGHPAHKELATGYGPCRLCLRTFGIGEDERLLFTYQPFFDPGAIPSPGPVFVHAEGCRRYDELEFPRDLRPLPMVIEGYRSGGQLLALREVGSRDPEDAVADVFATPGVAYAHVRNREVGCFMVRVDRCHAC